MKSVMLDTSACDVRATHRSAKRSSSSKFSPSAMIALLLQSLGYQSFNLYRRTTLAVDKVVMLAVVAVVGVVDRSWCRAS